MQHVSKAGRPYGSQPRGGGGHPRLPTINRSSVHQPAVTTLSSTCTAHSVYYRLSCTPDCPPQPNPDCIQVPSADAAERVAAAMQVLTNDPSTAADGQPGLKARPSIRDYHSCYTAGVQTAIHGCILFGQAVVACDISDKLASCCQGPWSKVNALKSLLWSLLVCPHVL
jgi:hypothetical protein